MLLWSLSGAPFHIMHALLLASASSETHMPPSKCKKGLHLHCGASDTTVGFLQAIKHVCFACDWINNARPPVGAAANEFHRKKCSWAGVFKSIISTYKTALTPISGAWSVFHVSIAHWPRLAGAVINTKHRSHLACGSCLDLVRPTRSNNDLQRVYRTHLASFGRKILFIL